MIVTLRLDLVELSPSSVAAAIGDIGELARLLDARIPHEWPPELLDAQALESARGWIADRSQLPTFGLYWLVCRAPTERVVIGVAGFKGMPRQGTAEVGYGVLPEFRRRGFASEAVAALVASAFGQSSVRRIIGETYPHLVASIGVLEGCGFHFVGPGSETDVIRYQLDRGA